MPWNSKNYPDSMKNLRAPIRRKAIEIANAMLSEKGMEEGIAIATGISRAKDWAESNGKPSDNLNGSKPTDVKKHGQDRYVIPYHGHWAIKVEGNKRISESFDHKPDAVKKAREAAKKANASLTIQLKSGKVQSRTSYNPNRRSQ